MGAVLRSEKSAAYAFSKARCIAWPRFSFTSRKSSSLLAVLLCQCDGREPLTIRQKIAWTIQTAGDRRQPPPSREEARPQSST
jgi:hypothetical protein